MSRIRPLHVVQDCTVGLCWPGSEQCPRPDQPRRTWRARWHLLEGLIGARLGRLQSEETHTRTHPCTSPPRTATAATRRKRPSRAPLRRGALSRKLVHGGLEQLLYIYLSIHYICLSIIIYIEREREGESLSIYIYIYIIYIIYIYIYIPVAFAGDRRRTPR